MCGLVGVYSSNMMNKHKEVLESLLYLDTWRGKDSTGIAAIRHNADTAILKATVPGYEFLEGPRVGNHLRLNDFCWIGHNRFGTVGKNIRSNAHPFQILDEQGSCILVGAHNGTLKNKHVLMDHADFGTDSEALYNHIAHTSLEETLPLVEGAWALTYYDHEMEELRFIRNKERPLHFAFEEGKKTMFWASEIWMIRIATSRAGIKLHKDKIYSCEEDTLYKFPAPDKMNEELTMQSQGGLVGKAPGFFQGRHWNGTGWVGGPAGQETQRQTNQTTNQAGTGPQQNQAQGTTVRPLTPPQTTSTSQSGNPLPGLGGKLPLPKEDSSPNPSSPGTGKVVSIASNPVYKGYGSKLITRAELKRQLDQGCSWCEITFINIGDRYGWLEEGKPVCSHCLDGTHPKTFQPAKQTSIH